MLSVMRSQLEPLMPHVQQVQDWVVEHPRLALSSVAALLGATYLASSALKGRKNLPPGPRYIQIVRPYLFQRNEECCDITVAILWAAIDHPVSLFNTRLSQKIHIYIMFKMVHIIRLKSCSFDMIQRNDHTYRKGLQHSIISSIWLWFHACQFTKTCCQQ